ncbi:MAG TPA: S8 family serine peptidase, partial [Vicinamibacterales bacterium]|nr:S8 family serine peptidase [Vicinamibacterales bacterium]
MGAPRGRLLAPLPQFRGAQPVRYMGLDLILPIALLACLLAPAGAEGRLERLDPPLRARAAAPRGWSQVIVRTVDGRDADELIRALGGLPGRRLDLVGGQVAQIPDVVLDQLAASPRIASVSLDRDVRATLERTGATIGARWVTEHTGLDGSGIGVALIDSGVTAWHDDLAAGRIAHFADFVNFHASPYDDYGHGTHVAGIIGGSGYHSNGARRGIAPGASLVVLKALDGSGGGHISNVIAALDYAVATRDIFNIRVVNLSVAAGVYESYTSDPLALAARRAVEAGIVVVAAAGNLGRDTLDQPQYGGIAAPGNAPW